MPVAQNAQALNKVIWDRNVTGEGINYLNERMREATSGDEMMNRSRTPFSRGTDPVLRDRDPGRLGDPSLEIDPNAVNFNETPGGDPNGANGAGTTGVPGRPGFPGSGFNTVM